MSRSLIIKEVQARSVLSESKIHEYALNPYTGCAHACSYCYARFMKRFTGHREPWGEFVDAKINAPELLAREATRKRHGTVWVSGVCDPYQPLERRYRLTRRCLEILAEHAWPVRVQTRSALVLRDVDVLRRFRDLEVGLSITTADDKVRKLFEPHAPSIPERLRALDELHRAGLRTYAMIAPMLPGSKDLVGELEGKVDSLLVDRMNYDHANRIYREHGLEAMRSDGYFDMAARTIASAAKARGISCRVVF